MCHTAQSAIGYDLTNPFDPALGIINRPNSWVPNGSKQTLIVEPGNVDNSFLVTKVERTDLDAHVDGSPMPFVVAPLDALQLDAVERWISDGAQNDDFFAESVAPIFGTQVTLRGTAGKCTFCHFPGNANHINVLDVFDAQVGLVNVDSNFGGKLVVPGDAANSVLMKKLTGAAGVGAPMPYVPARLTAAEVQALKTWIEEGALEN
jgi:hypothetical protein